MKIIFDKQKSSETISSLVSTTVDLSKKAATGVRGGVLSIMEKSKNDSLSRKLKKYNPLFPEQYQSPDFNLPNMIVIVDDAVRREIDVCKGAIGWISSDAGIEVLYLYDEAVSFCALQFIPVATCDAIYYVDSFDRNRFIRVDCIFSKAHEERMAELKHIAHSLGAKRCSIEISEITVESKTKVKDLKISEKYTHSHASETTHQNTTCNNSQQQSGRIVAEFQGSNIPKAPVLKWFAHDDSIRNLIDMRLNNLNSIKSEVLELTGTSSSTMSQKTASNIDVAISKIGGAKASVSLNERAAKEYHSKMLFTIEF